MSQLSEITSSSSSIAVAETDYSAMTTATMTSSSFAAILSVNSSHQSLIKDGWWSPTSDISCTSTSGDGGDSCRYSVAHVVLSAFVVSVIIVVIIAGNSLVILAIVRDRRHLGGLQNWSVVFFIVQRHISYLTRFCG